MFMIFNFILEVDFASIFMFQWIYKSFLELITGRYQYFDFIDLLFWLQSKSVF